MWAPLIENLADLGYEASNMYMAAYDWRLPFEHLEARDQSSPTLTLPLPLSLSLTLPLPLPLPLPLTLPLPYP